VSSPCERKLRDRSSTCPGYDDRSVIVGGVIASNSPDTCAPACQDSGRLIPTTANDLAISYLPLVRSIARQLFAGLPVGSCLEFEDLLQAGFVGLVSAARNYDPNTPVAFAVYAKPRIRGEILDTLRRLDALPRGLRQWKKQADSVRSDMAAKLLRQPTEEEIGEQLGVEASELRERTVALLSADPQAHDSRSTFELCADPDGGPYRIREQTEMRMMLHGAIDGLPERLREVLLGYYVRGTTMKDIGRELNISESAVSQLHRRALKLMAKALLDSGVTSCSDLR
jgi:RNA polymerase sigma factor FliA